MNMSKLVVRLRAVLCVAAFALVLFGCEQAVFEPEDALSTDRRAVPGVGASYKIGNEADLRDFAKRVINGEANANGTLTADIALTGTWDPIGFVASGTPVAYTGTFDGDDFAITGLNVESTGNFAGLFAVNRGAIQYLTVTGTVSSNAVDGNYVGGIVGYNSYT